LSSSLFPFHTLLWLPSISSRSLSWVALVAQRFLAPASLGTSLPGWPAKSWLIVTATVTRPAFASSTWEKLWACFVLCLFLRRRQLRRGEKAPDLMNRGGDRTLKYTEMNSKSFYSRSKEGSGHSASTTVRSQLRLGFHSHLAFV
jgi:hypothetical protein